ncbi:MAG: hypothetical protein H0X43_12650 [Nitrosospira sp.]|nr:hypothetical protein [Nitrosospira sp.]
MNRLSAEEARQFLLLPAEAEHRPERVQLDIIELARLYYRTNGLINRLYPFIAILVSTMRRRIIAAAGTLLINAVGRK